jgi:hypothetical protein
MAGLGPAIHALAKSPHAGRMGPHPYEQAKWTRAWHAISPGASGSIEKILGGGFTRRYGLTRLVWCEHHDTIVGAIQREKTVKHWPRAWTVRLIHAINPQWNDLYETIGSGPL